MAIQGINSGTPKYQMASSADSSGKAKETEAAHEAQKEAMKQIQQLQKQVQDTQRETASEEQEIRDQYERRSLDESSRQEDILSRQQQEGYQRLLDLRKTQSEEIAKTRKQGERQLEALNNYYREQAESTIHRNETSLRQQNAATQLQLQSQLNQAKAQETLQKVDAETQKKILEDRKLQDITTIKKEAEKEIGQTREQMDIANQRVITEAVSKHEALKNQHQKDLKRLYASAQKNIDAIREDTSRSLNRYGSQKTDPFYSTISLGANFSDAGDAYVLTALIPEYEQRSIGVTVKGDREIVLTGQRRSNETTDKVDGGKQTTSSFQAYSESFKTQFPVDKSSLEKSFEGDYLTVRVPKLGYETAKPFQKPAIEAPTIPKPKFPKSAVEA